MGHRPDDWSGVFRFGGDGLRDVVQIVLLFATISVFVGVLHSVTSRVPFESPVSQSGSRYGA